LAKVNNATQAFFNQVLKSASERQRRFAGVLYRHRAAATTTAATATTARTSLSVERQGQGQQQRAEHSQLLHDIPPVKIKVRPPCPTQN